MALAWTMRLTVQARVPAHRLAIDVLRRKGELAFVGESGAETPITVSPDMIRKGIVLRGSWHYNMRDVNRMMRIISQLGDQLDKFITHTFPIDQIQQAWETQVSGECAKVVIKPWEN